MAGYIFFYLRLPMGSEKPVINMASTIVVVYWNSILVNYAI
jgi:hypothetical protein